MHSNRRIIFAFLLITGAIAVGICGYMMIENYTFFEGFYMSVITLTTVGYGEVKPLSTVGRGFTTFYILLGFGSLAFAGHAIAELLLEKIFSSKSEIKKMRKKNIGINITLHHLRICKSGCSGI
ncbi:MAG: two pore domain potassium channel family protein [Deltaproteobacteria bacterium]|nr:two pore domain potassium channel family protein [Deltaproteobacteria bacterium]